MKKKFIIGISNPLILAIVTTLVFMSVGTVMAAVWTDQADYTPGSTVTIHGNNSDNAGYLNEETVNVSVNGPYQYNSKCSGTADPTGTWSCQVILSSDYTAEGNYTFTAVGQTSGVNQSGTFTDASTANVNFQTTGLPSGISITVTGTKIPNGLTQIKSFTNIFNSPGPSINEGAKPSTSFTYSFPATVSDSSGNMYNLVSSFPASPFTTGADKSVTTVTATYTLADSTPPTTTDNAPLTWQNADFTVTLTCTDNTGGSGCIQTQYSIDGGASQIYAIPISISTEGTHTITYFSVDKAGNTESLKTAYAKLDKTAPSITSSAKTADNNAYTSGTWTNQNVIVSFTCIDTLSGIASCTSPITVSTEGAGQSSTGAATDNADNIASATFSGIDIDKNAPTTSDNAPIDWQKADFTITLTCSDTLSGCKQTQYSIDGGASQIYTNPISISTEGDHTITYSSVDNAGNQEATKIVHAKLDKTPPTTTDNAPSLWQNTDFSVTLTCADNIGSGCKQTQYSIDGGASQTYTGPISISTEGDHTITYSSVDNAGNTETPKSVHAKLDKTPPTISAGAKTADNNAYTSGTWTNQNVIVSFTCSDTLSGIASCTSPITVSTEGTGQSSTGAATDNAGNTASTSFSGINIDKTSPTTSDNSPTDWQKADFTVTLTCTDNTGGSGCKQTQYSIDDGASQTYTNPISISTEGDHTITYSSVDNAGNQETAKTVHAKLDKTPPTTTDNAPGGWQKSDFSVILTCADNTGGSGCKQTQYSVDNGPLTAGTSVSISTEGDHIITYSSVDNAGNQETTKTVHAKLDKTLPTISAGAKTADNNAYISGTWANQNVIVSFDCNDVLSGIASCTSPITVSTEGAGQSSIGTAIDNAGNSASATFIGINIDKTAPTTTDNAPSTWQNKDFTVTLTCLDTGSGCKQTQYSIDGGASQTYTGPISISTEGDHIVTYYSVDNAGNTESPSKNVHAKLDKTPPTISGAATTLPNANGWYSGPVIAHFTATDSLSGIDTITPDQTLSSEGKGQSVTGTATDKAGNSASYTVSGINIDLTKPTITITAPANGQTYLLNQILAANYNCNDALSGIASCSGPVASGNNFDTTTVGAKTFTVNAQDKAGNSNATTNNYNIQYAPAGTTCDGDVGLTALQPINPDGSSVFKYGSTVPVKFRACDANGVSISTPGLIKSFIQTGSSADPNAVIDESNYSTTPDTAFRWDSTAQQWIFNLGTKNNLKSGVLYYFTITLDSGQTVKFQFAVR